ncbi:AMP-binding protein, partial [Pseudomonas syringae]
IVGIPDSKYGEQLVAWARIHPSHSVTDDELRLWAKGRSAHYKIPRHFKFVEAFPMTVTGKVQKFRMREVSIEELPGA